MCIIMMFLLTSLPWSVPFLRCGLAYCTVREILRSKKLRNIKLPNNIFLLLQDNEERKKISFVLLSWMHRYRSLHRMSDEVDCLEGYSIGVKLISSFLPAFFLHFNKYVMLNLYAKWEIGSDYKLYKERFGKEKLIVSIKWSEKFFNFIYLFFWYFWYN